MLIYFAGPLFSLAERSFNLRLTARLEAIGYRVFLPQRDGAELKAPYSRLLPADRRQAIFDTDRDRILEADVFLFILDGRVPDEGAAVELGMAYAQKHLGHRQKLLIGLYTDVRGAFSSAKLNPMLVGPLEHIVHTEEELVDQLQRYLDSLSPS
jgi:nucleoside 2-deoxyribosyltransferase